MSSWETYLAYSNSYMGNARDTKEIIYITAPTTNQLQYNHNTHYSSPNMRAIKHL